MIQTVLFDFARVLLFVQDRAYQGSLSQYYQQLIGQHTSIWDCYRLNEELLTVLKNTYQHQYQLAILTASETLPRHPEVAPKLTSLFNPILLAKELGVSKDQPACYTTVCKILQKKPTEVVFIDDSARNVAAAQTAGLPTIHFSDTQSALKELALLTHDHSTL